MEETIFYHEDEYCQIELIPNHNYFKSQRDMLDNPIPDHSELGYFNITIRDKHHIKTETLKIDVATVLELLKPYTLRHFNTVTTGYSQTVLLKKNTLALGFERLALFFEYDNHEIIQNIWMCKSHLLPVDFGGQNLFNALMALGSKYELILVDWNEDCIVRLSYRQAVEYYLRETFLFTLL